MTTVPEPLLTTDDVAALLSVSPTTVRRYVSAGLLRGSKPAKRWYVTRSDLDAYLANHSNGAAGAVVPSRRRRRR